MLRWKKFIFTAILAIAVSVSAYQVMHSRSLRDNGMILSGESSSQQTLRSGRGEHAGLKNNMDRRSLSAGISSGSAAERGRRGEMEDGTAKQSAPSALSAGSVLSGNGSTSNAAPVDDSVRHSMMTGTNGWLGRTAEDRYEVVQSAARPYGLEVIAPVQMAQSDQASEEFAEAVLPDVLDYIESNVVYTVSNELISVEATLSNLTLTATAPVRVYFVSEDGAYHNAIGLQVGDSADGEMESKLIFPDASSAYSYWKNVKDKVATSDLPLMPGDFVDIGVAQAGSSLNLFVIPDGARQAQQAYGITKELNEDMLAHSRIYGVVGDSMILIGFEDLPGGGDLDYNDVMLAVEIGKANVDSISARLGLHAYSTNSP
ncbi:MAG: DUF4114 domain-containing protein [bacterium]